MSKSKKTPQSEAPPASAPAEAGAQEAPVPPRTMALREISRVCAELIQDTMDWERLEERSAELFGSRPLPEQAAMLQTIDSAIGRLRSGLLKAASIYRFRNVYPQGG